MTSKKKLLSLVFSAMFLALAMVLPFLTGQIPRIGKMLCPMHFPVLLCGFFCGPAGAFAVGFIAPLLRFFLFGMPALMPDGVAMCLELSVYGLVSALLFSRLPKKTSSIYVSLIGAMLAGRLAWAVARVILFGLGKSPFGWAAFLSGAFVNAFPGIILQIVLIPVLVLVLKKYTYRGE